MRRYEYHLVEHATAEIFVEALNEQGAKGFRFRELLANGPNYYAALTEKEFHPQRKIPDAQA